MSEEDTKVADLFDKDIENFGNDLDKMIEHLNIVIATHNKQVEEIERLNNIINELEKTLNNYDLDYMDLVGEHLLADILEDLKDKIKELKGSDKE